jgi:ornithine cyclodeaminase
MGSDAPGKQELPRIVFPHAGLFCGLPPQSVRIGDFRHCRCKFEDHRQTLTAIGDVIAARDLGRTSDRQITVFGSSGNFLQNLRIASALINACKADKRRPAQMPPEHAQQM